MQSSIQFGYEIFFFTVFNFQGVGLTLLYARQGRMGQVLAESLHYMPISGLWKDEWMLIPRSEHEARDLLENIEIRHKRGSPIFASQFSPKGWHEKIGESTLADAILDWIVHDSYTIVIDGEDSMCKRKGIQNK